MKLSTDEQIMIDLASNDAMQAPSKPPSHAWFFVSAFIVIAMILWLFPLNSAPIRPHNVPGAERIPSELSLSRPNTTLVEDFVLLTPAVKALAATIATRSCSKNDARCFANAQFMFVRDTITYVTDPLDEYYETPEETLYALAADCDGQAILLRSLQEAVGIHTRFKHTPGHLTVEAWLPKKDLFAQDGEFEWVHYDPTCTSCRIS